MRNNQPVINQEHKLGAEDFLISRTTRGGRITYANNAFIQVSGFPKDELIGAPHNIVRHPDMPPAAFADLWKTLKAGKTWVGLVKNRRKNGGFYWVKAHVAPILEEGKTQGYVSVRTRAARADIERAERIYAGLRNGGGAQRLHAGKVVAKGLQGLLATAREHLADLGGQGLLAAVATALLLIVALGGGEGIAGTGMPLLALAGTAGLWGLAWWSSRRQRRALTDLQDFALQIAAGNLAAQMPARRSGFGMLADTLEIMRLSLASIAGDVRDGVGIVTPATHEINEASQQLAARIEKQAAFLQQTVTSVEQIMAAVQQSAGNAGEANQLTASTADSAGNSGQAMRGVVESMSRITDSASRMSAIIDVIDSIAFQTNILALNASVEAARAGEQGRGFAVVAGEVRNLARRSAEAANEVRALIARSTEEIAEGGQEVDKAEQAIDAVVQAVSRMKDIVADIAEASRQQNTGIGEINAAVAEMDGVTRDNAQRLQTTAAACAVLDEQMDMLAHSVAVFRLAGAGLEDAALS